MRLIRYLKFFYSLIIFCHAGKRNPLLYFLPVHGGGMEIFMKVTICIGSSCHIKGSRHVVQALSELVEKHNLEDKVELAGTFCMGQCQDGVCVSIKDTVYSVSPETVGEFFENEILAKL